jgi:putative membrane protein
MAERKSDTSTDLARERNREAAERTLMAWIRTSMSMIGFGIGFGAAGAVLDGGEDQPMRVHDLEFVGSGFILLAIVSLIAAVIQNRRVLNRIRQSEFVYVEPVPIGLVTAILMLLFGLLGLIWVNFR